MAIVNMYGFNQCPLSEGITDMATVAAFMANEGFPFNMAGSAVSYSFGITDFGDGQRRALLTVLTNGAASRAAYLSATLDQLFGTGAPQTKWYLGLRMKASAFTASSGTLNLLVLGTTAIVAMPAIPYPLSEFYLELCFDFANSLIHRRVDGKDIGDVALPAVNGATVLHIGSSIYSSISNWVAISDIYTVVDTSATDGGSTPSSWLGPVRVRPVEVDTATLPGDWSVAPRRDLATFSGTQYDNVIPSMALSTYNGFVVSANKGNHSSWPLPNVSHTTGSGAQWITANNPTVAAPLNVQYQLDTPRTALGYSLRYPGSGMNYPDTWQFQGSNDGTNWITLDTRSGQGPVISALGAGNDVFYLLDPGVVASYRYYRLALTAASPTANTYFAMLGFRIFQVANTPVTAENVVNEEAWYDGVNIDPSVAGSLKTSTTGNAASFSLAIPNTGLEPIKKVQVRVGGWRQSGSEEYLVAHLKEGATVQADQTYGLSPAGTEGIVLLDSHTDLNGQPWTKAAVDSLEVVLKSKSGV